MDRTTKDNTSKRNERIKYCIVYTLLFVVCCCFCFFQYYSQGKSLIYTGDGWSQHYKAYIYYGRYLKGIARNIFIDHRLVIPQWDFSIGEGAGIIETFHYYVVGDPFAFLTLFVPERLMQLYYDFSILLRLYFAGLFFSFLCFYAKKENYYAVLSGAIVYDFCFWAIFNAARHIYFLNPLVYLPLIILGAEKVMNRDNPYLFVFAVTVSSLSNFYFFYNIVVITVIYVLARLALKNKTDIKKSIVDLMPLLKYSLMGVMISAVLLLPIVFVFLHDARMEISFDHHLFYPIYYYLKLPSMFLSTSRYYWLCMGYASPVLIAVLSTFINFKDSKLIAILNTIAVIMVLFPIFGQIMNGFSYISNKWCFAISLLVSFNLVAQWDEIQKHRIVLSLLFVFVSTVCLFYGFGVNMNIPLLICGLFLAIQFISANSNMLTRVKNLSCILLIVLNVSFLANWQYAPYGSNYISFATLAEEDRNITQTSEAYSVAKYSASSDDSGFFRYSGSSLTQNASILFNVHSTDYYWSLTNPYVAKYRSALNLEEYKLYNFREYDKRSILYSLANVKYYVVPNSYDGLIPYGFEFQESLDDHDLYVNQYYLPFGYTYCKAISADVWNRYDGIEKEEILLQAVVLDELDHNDEVLTSERRISFDYVCNEGIRFDDNKIVVEKTDSTIILNFTLPPGCEAFLTFEGLQYDDGQKWIDGKTTQVKINLVTSENIRKSITYGTTDDKYGNGRSSFVSYLGCNDDNDISSVKISFSSKGTYSFTDLFVSCRTTTDLDRFTKELSEETLDNVVFGTNTVTGTIRLKQNKYLLLSIPYSKGWKAYVDGKETELLNANITYMALYLNPGYHEIKLVYRTPLLRLGVLLSFLGLAWLVVDATIKAQQKQLDLLKKQ